MNIAKVDESFVDFVHATSRDLSRLATLLSGQGEDPADLVQTVYEKVYRKWPLDPDQAPGGYARTVMVNLSVDRGRRLRRQRSHLLPSEPSEQADLASAVDLRRALAALPPRRRTVLVLRFYADFTEAATAAVLGISVGAVKSTQARALAQLREHLNDREVVTR